MNSIYPYTVNDISGRPVSLETYRNQVLLVVNTASFCGFTPQYRDMEALFRQYRHKGFTVLGFPCNQFGKQEPGDNRSIADFCQSNYAISFPLFEKIEVNGSNTHPLFQYLKTAAPGVFGSTSIKWNFTKFLIKKDGTASRRYGPLIPVSTITSDIEKLLTA